MLAAYSIALVFRGTAGLQSTLLLGAFLILLLEQRDALAAAWAEARWVLGPLLLFSCWVFAICPFWREPPLRAWDPGGWDVSQPWFSLDQWRRDIAQPMLALFCAWWTFRDEYARRSLYLLHAALILLLAAKGVHQFGVGELLVDGLHQRGTLQVRGFSRDNIFFSYVLLLLTPGALWLTAHFRGRRFSWGPLFVLLVMAFLNKRRGTWIAIYVEFLMLAMWMGRRRFLAFVFGSMLFGVAAFAVRPQWFLRDYDTNRTGRIEMTRVYPALLAESPFVGVGFGKDTVVKNYWHRIYQHAHNAFVNVALEIGWPGLAFWLAALGAYAARFRRVAQADLSARIGLAFLAAFCIRNLTDDVWISSNAELFWFQIGLLLPGRPVSRA
ncbi:MAG: O-antigen ligase family protein [Verrucomicrobiae bacterium]|nr:O-antigen ligase family protein [Verrucomicrobiae bacterium]